MKKLLVIALLVLPGVASAQAIQPQDIVADTNIYRMAHQEQTLKLNPVLCAIAAAKANDMLTNNYWAHVSPSGKDPWYWFKLIGYKYQYAGENLAVGFLNDSATMQAWEQSPTHNANLLNAHYKEIGVAVVYGQLQGRWGYLVVQEFGSTQ